MHLVTEQCWLLMCQLQQSLKSPSNEEQLQASFNLLPTVRWKIEKTFDRTVKAMIMPLSFNMRRRVRAVLLPLPFQVRGRED